ncbi:MAG TPA: HEPN domain-containing protein [Streptosporangiaceae bacterium]|nr:HEPN domain-containing protein [Streptosporangiaceae bacterium]
MTWQPGNDRIAELLAAGELQQVTADRAMALLLLDDARRHLVSAAAASASGDLSGAYLLAYDALRKSAASLLAVQGLRSTSRGGHIAIQEAVVAQFGSTVRVFRSFSRIRRARNGFEYPSTATPGPSADDVTDAISIATQTREAAVTILEQDLLTKW